MTAIRTEPFLPHSHETLLKLRAFPEGSLPETAYQRLCEQYAAVDDVDVFRITYPSGDLAITGIAAFPKQKNAAAPRLVIYNRGGSGNYGMLTVHAVMRQFVPLARAGYIVVGSNYRGNDGSEGHDEFGGRDVDDIFALHDIARKEWALSDAPCFMIGHSRGAMMTALAIKRGLPVQSACLIAGVSDLRESARVRPEMREKVYTRFIRNFEAREEELLRERSSICWPEALNLPVLLLHGTKDEAVPHTQSEQLAAKLKTLGSPHELVLYEGGNHALIRHWDDVTKNMLEWFAS